jgi:hypothetical protein
MATRRNPYASTDNLQHAVPSGYADAGYDPYQGNGGVPTAPGVPPPAATAPPGLPPPPETPHPAPAPKKYAAIQGFDLGKIDGSKPFDSGSKYSDSLRGFSNFLGEGGHVGRGEMSDLEKWWSAQGHQGGHAVGDDKFDFGDGQGPIDIINSKGDIWFQNGDDRFGGGGGAGGGEFPPMPFPQGGGNSGGGGSASSSSSRSMPDMGSVMSMLQGIMNNGGNFNEGAVGRRLDSVRGSLERQRKSMEASDRAIMGERGLLGSGAEKTNSANIFQDIGDSFDNSLQGIYADEADRADSRMIQALQMATGMSEEEARNAVSMAGIDSNERLGHERNANDASRNANDFFLGNRNADLGFLNSNRDFTLGQANTAIANNNSVNGWNQFVTQNGLDRDRLAFDIQHGNNQSLIDLINQYLSGANISAGGHY